MNTKHNAKNEKFISFILACDNNSTYQSLTQKIFMGCFHSVAYGGHSYLVCAVCGVTISRHIHVCKPTFSRNLL